MIYGQTWYRALVEMAVASLALALAVASCGPSDFDAQSKVSSVRIFATQADKPYAAPGESVVLQVLAYDGRPEALKGSRAMEVYWLPFVCFNPPQDFYYLCFGALGVQPAPGRASQAGAYYGPLDGAAALLPTAAGLVPGADLTDFLQRGPSVSFTLPADIVARHPPVAGTPAPYGLAIVFNIACSGRVRLLAVDPNDQNPLKVPIGCFDPTSGQQLGPDDYVIGFARVYAYENLRNQNPVIEDVTFDGVRLAGDEIRLPACREGDRDNCPKRKIGVLVPDSSQEDRPGGETRKEQVWASYYATVGDLDSDTRVLYSQSGKVPDADNDFRAPSTPGAGKMWIVVRDNRGGVSWREITVRVL